MKFKMTPLEKKWVLYDVGNSAFAMLTATILPIYFNCLAKSAGLSSVDYLAYWGYAVSVCTLLVAVMGPTLGAIADVRNLKKRLFFVCLVAGTLGCAVLGFIPSWFFFLVVFVLTNTGYSASLIFYDSMLTDVTEPKRMDTVSSQGFAWGYIGSCIPFVAGLMFVLFSSKIGITLQAAMTIAFIITAVWWFGSTVPLLGAYRQRYYVEKPEKLVSHSLRRLGHTVKDIFHDKKVFMFLLAYFFYIDGVFTVIDMATAYGKALGLNSTGLLLALLVTQIVAFPSVLILNEIAKKVSPTAIITVCIVAYLGISLYAYGMHTQLDFWILAVVVGMFQGTIQALSRSYFGKIIPPEKSGEYFGLYDIFGKGASILGTIIVSLVSQLTGNLNLSVSALSILFLIGLVLFRKAVRLNEASADTNQLTDM